jgi:hypothetical protein
MRFMSVIKAREDQGPPPQELMEAIAQFVIEAKSSGRLIDTGGLEPSAQGVRFRSSGGVVTVTDGPYAEAKEVVGGYAIMEYATKEDAIEGTRQFMELHAKYWPEFEGEAELRQVFGPEDVTPH